jgi:hypothetical protein
MIFYLKVVLKTDWINANDRKEIPLEWFKNYLDIVP